MNVYSAIMKAADHVEREPSLYEFRNVRVPDCGSPGCMLGWIGYFLGIRPGTLIQSYCSPQVATPAKLLGLKSQTDFYQRLNDFGLDGSYVRDHKFAARVMRLYAEKYHSGESSAEDAAFKRFLTAALNTPALTAAAGSAS